MVSLDLPKYLKRAAAYPGPLIYHSLYRPHESDETKASMARAYNSTSLFLLCRSLAVAPSMVTARSSAAYALPELLLPLGLLPSSAFFSPIFCISSICHLCQLASRIVAKH